jgi:hypothetical protein
MTAASKYTHDKIHTLVSLHVKSGEICDGLTIDILLVSIFWREEGCGCNVYIFVWKAVGCTPCGWNHPGAVLSAEQPPAWEQVPLTNFIMMAISDL